MKTTSRCAAPITLAMMMLAACTTVEPVESARTSATDTRQVVNRYLAAVEAGDAAAAAQLFAPTARYEDVTFGFAIDGAPAIEDMLTGAIASLDPVERRIVREIFDGGQAAVEWEATGTHVSPMLGVPATNRRITIKAVSLMRVDEGQIVSVTDYTDRASLERQLKAGSK